ncbi:uncharacterized protein LOC135371131 [Ornithodoros turicata]|uniref:uncharacterized protein LOC135371131 n=1 Tax=Ornithodoros turicata TaxID=34597 RepID=UPI003139AD9B
MSSDSSDEEESARLREAAVSSSSLKSKASRMRGEDNENFEYKEYIQKCLFENIEKQILEVRGDEPPCKGTVDSGIRLLSDSTVDLDPTSTSTETASTCRKRPKLTSVPEATEEMLASVAVTPEWVMKQSGTHPPAKESTDHIKHKKRKKKKAKCKEETT